MTSVVSQYYLEGIKDGRRAFREYGMSIAQSEIDNLKSTLRGFSGQSPVGQMLRGELDFWRNQIKRAGK